jgi:hypothetical protein
VAVPGISHGLFVEKTGLPHRRARTDPPLAATCPTLRLAGQRWILGDDRTFPGKAPIHFECMLEPASSSSPVMNSVRDGIAPSCSAVTIGPTKMPRAVPFKRGGPNLGLEGQSGQTTLVANIDRAIGTKPSAVRS